MIELNKKGTSIIELIISIALLSIVLTFMLKLLVDLNNIRTNSKFAKDNQIIRSEIIRTIENDIKNKTITNITSTKNGNNIRLTFTFTNGSSIMDITPTTLSYLKTNGNSRKWAMEDCKLYTSKIYLNKIISTNSCSFILNIQVHTSNNENNASRNNPLDDIQISYFINNDSYCNFNDYYE